MRRTLEHNQKISDALRGRELHKHSEKTKQLLAAKAYKSWSGGEFAEHLSSLLCPVGFVREFHFTHISIPYWISMDFAHTEGRVNIELDGPYHGFAVRRYNDKDRDTILRSLGWKVIRVKHD